MSIRNACHAPVVLLILFLFAPWPPALAEDQALAGRVSDARGDRLPGATVFITRVGHTRRLAEVSAQLRGAAAGEGSDRVLKTAPDGTFSALLPIGRYRIAVFNPGYEVALAEINLRARDLVEIRLSSASQPDGEDDVAERADRGLDWILRVPGGDALRDRDAGLDRPARPAVLVAREGPGRAPLAARLALIDGDLRQDWSGADLFGGELPGPDDASGRSTRLNLRGSMGARGGWNFDGLRNRTSTAALPGEPEVKQGRTNVGLGGGVRHALGSADDLRADLLYASSRYLFDPGEAAGVPVEQRQENAALSARWDRALARDFLMHVAGSYREATLRQPATGRTSAEQSVPGGPPDETAGDRSADAAAGLALRRPDHAIALEVRFHSFRYDLGDDGGALSRLTTDPVLLETRRRGNAMIVSGGDDWRVAEGYVVNYGLGFHHDLASGNAYVVPRVGLTTTLPEAGDLILRSAVMYRFEDDAFSRSFGPGPDRRVPFERGRLGYVIGVERRPERRFQFAATLAYRPFQEIPDDRSAAALPTLLENGPLIRSDGAAGRHEMEFEVERVFGLVRGVLLGGIGRVRGRLGPILEEGPFVEFQPGEARYYVTGMRAMITPTDTEVRVDYRRVTGETGASGTVEATPLDYRRLDLAILQDLPFSPLMAARFRLLMAYQDLLYDSAETASLPPGAGAVSRVTGGLDISF